jgi:hypothetical protein
MTCQLPSQKRLKSSMSLFHKKQHQTDEFARVIEWNPKWSTGAPMPQVFSNGQKTYLIYLINEPDPNWDGTYTTMIDQTSETMYPLALVEFYGSTFRFGIANDEVFNGLPLWGKGLEFYAAHIIENSSWIAEVKNINKVHPGFSEAAWKDQTHFALLFHDEIFEIIASGYKVEILQATFEQAAIEVVRRMYE